MLPSFLALIQPSTSHFIFKLLAASRDLSFTEQSSLVGVASLSAAVPCPRAPWCSILRAYARVGGLSGRADRAFHSRARWTFRQGPSSGFRGPAATPRLQRSAPPICVLFAHAICVRGSSFSGLTHPAPRRLLVLLHFLSKCFYSHQCAQQRRFVFGSFRKFSQSGLLVALLSKSAGKMF